jgi:murein DD-endopeptidase MepM/ murein hydrolase activator NlpD
MATIRWKKKFQKWQNKGKESVSFVVIPHSEKIVVSLDMSFAMLIFLTLLSAILMALSLSVLVYYSLFWKKDDALYRNASKDQSAFLYYSMLSERLEESVQEFEKQTEDLNLIAWEEVSWNRLITQDYFPEIEVNQPDFREMETNLNLYPRTVQSYAEMNVRLKRIQPVFQNAMDYLDMRESIFINMPRGRPLGPGVGNVTSTWGYRMDPFGILPVGEFHSGIDFAAAEGTPIYATAPGIVPKTEVSSGGLGRSVRINHENGFFTLYGHCSQLLVKEGDIVKRGDKIALVGQTGKATGAHVHYEVRVGLDSPMDPEEFINLD